jgi:hypothetical protein
MSDIKMWFSGVPSKGRISNGRRNVRRKEVSWLMTKSQCVECSNSRIHGKWIRTRSFQCTCSGQFRRVIIGPMIVLRLSETHLAEKTWPRFQKAEYISTSRKSIGRKGHIAESEPKGRSGPSIARARFGPLRRFGPFFAYRVL